MKIRCRDAIAARDDPSRALAYGLSIGRMLQELERKYAAAGEPPLTPLDEAREADMAKLMNEYSGDHPDLPMRAAVRHAYFAMRAAVFGSPTVN